jgi:hypothetical protein
MDSPEEKARIAALIEQACAALDRHDAAALGPVVAGLEIQIGHGYSDGITSSFELPAKLFADGAAYAAALRRRTPEATQLALPILAGVDAAAAAPIFHAMLLANLTFWTMSYEGNAQRAAGLAYDTLMPLLSARAVAELWAIGAVQAEHLEDRHLAALTVDELLDAIAACKLDPDPPGRVIGAQPALATADARAAFLDRVLSGPGRREYQLVAWLFRDLTAARHPRAVELAARVDAEEDDHRAAIDVLLELHHVPTLTRWSKELDARAASTKRAWDPHHVSLDLGKYLRGRFALDPATATERFAAWFTPKALASDHGAKLAADALNVGRGVYVDHAGTVLPTGDRDWLDLDPRWLDVVAKLVGHKRLDKLARAVLQRLPLGERRKRIAAAKPAPAKAPKPRAKPKLGKKKKPRSS